MELVLGTHALVGFGGSESYLITMAEQLERSGHGVTLYAEEVDESGEAARQRGLRVAEGEEALPAACDGVLVQEATTALELAGRYPDAPQVFVAHSPMFDLQLPPQVEGVVSAVVAMNEQVAARVRALALDGRLVRLRQPVDLRRFSPRGPAPARPRRAIALGNYLRGDRRAALERACAGAGIALETVGRYGTHTSAPEGRILDADLVVGHGRSIVEAMSCGRAALVYDQWGGDGWVTPAAYETLEANGFAGTATPESFDEERLRAELDAWDPDMGPRCRDLAVAHHSAQSHARVLVDLLRSATGKQRPPAPLEELARLARVARRAEGRAAELELENEQLRSRLAQTLEDAERRLATLQSTRRYRLAARLARPLDRVREARARGPR